jgi:hypothetical protein
MNAKFRVFKRRAATWHGAFVADIAARCARAVAQQVTPNAMFMDVAELRGYLRARALPIVLACISQHAPDRARSEPPPALVAAALERTIQLVVRDFRSLPIVAIPAPHVPRRAAA